MRKIDLLSASELKRETVEINKIYKTDCLRGLKLMKANSVDLICCDPPYGTYFMLKSWDKDLPSEEIIAEMFRVLKNGSFAFIMCSSRQDVMSEMLDRLKKAGFIINFTSLYWTYSTGFTKSMNVSKAIDKKLGLERDIIINPIAEETPFSEKVSQKKYTTHKLGEPLTFSKPVSELAKEFDGSFGGFQPKPAVEPILIALKPLQKILRNDVYEKLQCKYDFFYTQTIISIPNKEILKEREVKQKIIKLNNKYNIKLKVGDEIEKRIALNPHLNDEIILNRKEVLESESYKNSEITSYYAQAIMNGKGITWLDDVRIPIYDNSGVWGTSNKSCRPSYSYHNNSPKVHDYKTKKHSKGRFTASLLVSDDVLNTYSRYFDLNAWWTEQIKELPKNIQKTFPFLIVAKPSKKEKNLGLNNFIGEKVRDGRKAKVDYPSQRGETIKTNIHPTIKPIQLFSYLIMLGSREGDLVVDPFGGTGTTAISCFINNRNFILFEIDQEYYNISLCRVNYYLKQRRLTDF